MQNSINLMAANDHEPLDRGSLSCCLTIAQTGAIWAGCKIVKKPSLSHKQYFGGYISVYVTES